MARYSLNLPEQLKRDAETWASNQGVSLNQFILWAVAERVASLGLALDDPRFPRISYRRGGSGEPVPVVVGTGVRVRTVDVAARKWGWDTEQIADELDLTVPQVDEALRFADEHRALLDATVAAEAQVETEHLEQVEAERASA